MENLDMLINNFFLNQISSSEIAKIIWKENKEEQVSSILMIQQEKYDRNYNNCYLLDKIVMKTEKLLLLL